MMSLVTKSRLRKLMKESLKNLSEQEKRLQSDAVANRLFGHPKYQKAKSISLYLSTSNEIDTISILRRCLDIDQKQCFIPYIQPRTSSPSSPRMSMVEIKSMAQFEALPVNGYGIKEPKEVKDLVACKPGDLDLVLVPGLAFTLDGCRLGHGMGYYDEFLTCSRHPKSPGSYTIGLAFKQQLVPELPQEAQDYKLDEILVPDF